MNMAMMHCRMKNDAPEDGGVRGTDEKRSLTKQSHPAKRNGKKDGREFSRLFSVWRLAVRVCCRIWILFSGTVKQFSGNAGLQKEDFRQAVFFIAKGSQ